MLFNAKLSHPVLARKRAELGGVEQTIAAWVSGDIRMDQSQLVDQLTRIVDELAVRDLHQT